MKTLRVAVEDIGALGHTNMTQVVSNAICHGIKDLGVHKRPIHCLDLKRKKMCIKEHDTWRYDEARVNSNLHKVNSLLQYQCHDLIARWEQDHPNWKESESETDKYMQQLSIIVDTIDEKRCAADIARHVFIPK